MIEWRPSEFDTQKEYGYFGEIRCFTLDKGRSLMGAVSWILTPNLPGAKGLIGRNPAGFPTRAAAEKQAREGVDAFAEMWAEALRQVEAARQEETGLTARRTPRESA